MSIKIRERMVQVPVTKHKAFAYITYQQQLLIFRHLDFPEVGLQVPAGTVEPGEDPADAVLREAFEETGLSDLKLEGFLGLHIRDMSDWHMDEINHRHFYHLSCQSHPPTLWHHEELFASDGSTEPIRFELFWVRIPDNLPELFEDHGRMLPQLLERFVN
jgi:8-oxo-dGTP diphosphatase